MKNIISIFIIFIVSAHLCEPASCLAPRSSFHLKSVSGKNAFRYAVISMAMLSTVSTVSTLTTEADAGLDFEKPSKEAAISRQNKLQGLLDDIDAAIELSKIADEKTGTSEETLKLQAFKDGITKERIAVDFFSDPVSPYRYLVTFDTSLRPRFSVNEYSANKIGPLRKTTFLIHEITHGNQAHYHKAEDNLRKFIMPLAHTLDPTLVELRNKAIMSFVHLSTWEEVEAINNQFRFIARLIRANPSFRDSFRREYAAYDPQVQTYEHKTFLALQDMEESDFSEPDPSIVTMVIAVYCKERPEFWKYVISRSLSPYETRTIPPSSIMRFENDGIVVRMSMKKLISDILIDNTPEAVNRVIEMLFLDPTNGPLNAFYRNPFKEGTWKIADPFLAPFG
ncbi:MAG: hypothetical protein JW774_01845, partial [Candidatus Aureabacteria bacterium]|nr:hypothetical protein [Candidatus Auribacterota bacterium]